MLERAAESHWRPVSVKMGFVQALSSYNPETHFAVTEALRAFEEEHKEQGVKASSYVSRPGWFARFVWVDWPSELATNISDYVQRFYEAHPQLQPVQEGSEEWNAVFRGWRSDKVSAEAIGKAFVKHFGSRILWVESQKNLRGLIAARCRIKDLVEAGPLSANHPLGQILGTPDAAESEVVSLELSWKGPGLASPRGPVSEADMKLLLASTHEVFDWAARRIQSVLDSLHDRLQRVYGERFRGLYVFGSYAKPDKGVELPPDSDLDVALILDDFENPYTEIDQIGEITSEMSLDQGLLISVVPIREADYKAGRTNFIRVISEYATPV